MKQLILIPLFIGLLCSMSFGQNNKSVRKADFKKIKNAENERQGKEYYYKTIADNGMLVFYNKEHYNQVYSELKAKHESFLNKEEVDVASDDNFDYYPELARFEKEYKYKSMRRHFDELEFNYLEKAGKDIKSSPGSTTDDIILETLLNKRGMLKIGDAIIYSKGYGRDYVIMRGDTKALEKLEKLSLKEVDDKNLYEQISPNVFTAARFTALALDDIVCGFPPRGGGNTGGSFMPGGSSNNCDANSAFTITHNYTTGVVNVSVNNQNSAFTYSWQFGSQTGTGASTNFTPTATGNISIVLTASDASNNTYTCTKQTFVYDVCDANAIISVLANDPVNVQVVPGSPLKITVALKPNIIQDLLFDIDTYTWTIGGATYTSSTATHTFACSNSSKGYLVLKFKNPNCENRTIPFDINVKDACCLYEAIHRSSIGADPNSFVWRNYTGTDGKLYSAAFRHKQTRHTFYQFPLTFKEGTQVSSKLKHYKWKNGRFRPAVAGDLRIKFKGNVYSTDPVNNCNCKIPRELLGAKHKNNKKVLEHCIDIKDEQVKAKKSDLWKVEYKTGSLTFEAPIYLPCN